MVCLTDIKVYCMDKNSFTHFGHIGLSCNVWESGCNEYCSWTRLPRSFAELYYLSTCITNIVSLCLESPSVGAQCLCACVCACVVLCVCVCVCVKARAYTIALSVTYILVSYLLFVFISLIFAVRLFCDIWELS